MTPANQARLKGLLGVMVRRHTRKDHPSHPVGRLIAEEARRLHGETCLSTCDPDPCDPELDEPDFGHLSSGETGGDAYAGKEVDQRLVDRLYRRYLLPRHPTVEAFAECDTVTCDDR